MKQLAVVLLLAAAGGGCGKKFAIDETNQYVMIKLGDHRRMLMPVHTALVCETNEANNEVCHSLVPTEPNLVGIGCHCSKDDKCDPMCDEPPVGITIGSGVHPDGSASGSGSGS